MRKLHPLMEQFGHISLLRFYKFYYTVGSNLSCFRKIYWIQRRHNVFFLQSQTRLFLLQNTSFEKVQKKMPKILHSKNSASINDTKIRMIKTKIKHKIILNFLLISNIINLIQVFHNF
jgi:hypothetical protein